MYVWVCAHACVMYVCVCSVCVVCLVCMVWMCV